MSRSKRVFGLIKKHFPELVLCKDMLVLSPTEHVLRGFLLETTTERDKVYLWRVVTPLYRLMTNVFLDYSNRIPNGEKLHIDRNAPQESADAVCIIIAEHIPFLQKIRCPHEFLKHVSWMIGNDFINFRFDLALTYYLVGDVPQAKEILQTLAVEVDQLEWRRRMPIDESIKRAAKEIESDPTGFAALLEEWENRNVETLELQPSRLSPQRLDS